MSVVLEPREVAAVQHSLLLQSFELLGTAPGGVARLRELILTLAVRGMLVPQDQNDEPASTILQRIRAERSGLSAAGKNKGPSTPERAAELGNLPRGWIWSNLASIGLINPRNHATDDTLASFVQMSSVPVAFSEPHKAEDRPWIAIKSGFTQFAEGDVGLAKITPCFENGKSTVFRGLRNGIGAGTTELHIVRPLGGIDPRYVLLFLKTPAFLLEGERQMTGSAGQKRLPRAYFEARPFPLAPLAEQSRIVARVDELMRLCDALEAKGRLEAAQHAQLLDALLGALSGSSSSEELAENWQRVAMHFDLLLDRPDAVDALEQTILQLAVRGLLVRQEAGDEPVDLSGVFAEGSLATAGRRAKHPKPWPTILDAEKPFELPKGWAWTRAGEAVSMLNGYAFKSEWFKAAGVRLLRNLNVSHGSTAWTETACIEFARASEFEQFALKAGDVVLSLDRPIISTGLKFAVIRESDLPCLLLQRVARLAPNNVVMSSGFLVLWLQSDLFTRTIDPGRSNGVPHISTKQVGNLVMGVPPLAEQSRIVARVEHFRRSCAELRQRLSASMIAQGRLAEALVEEVAA